VILFGFVWTEEDPVVNIKEKDEVTFSKYAFIESLIVYILIVSKSLLSVETRFYFLVFARINVSSALTHVSS